MSSLPRSGQQGVRPLPLPFEPDQLYVRIPGSALSLAGFRAWIDSEAFPETMRASFIDGEIHLEGKSEEVNTHLSVKGAVVARLLGLVDDEDLGYFLTRGTQVSNVEANLSVNPDAIFASWDALDVGRIRLVPRENGRGHEGMEGTLDWVLEIVSDSTEDRDTRLLRRAYHQAGIPEYWLIDARGKEIVFQILCWRKSGYAQVPVRDGWRMSRVFGRQFRLTRKRDRMNLWDYRLEMRP